MKGTNVTLTALFMLLGTAQAAFAVDTAKTYNSGLLVLFFLGVCALIVVAQLIPAVIALVGSIRGLAKDSGKQANAKARSN